MSRHVLNHVIILMAGPGLAVLGLLLVFLALGQNTAGAALDRDSTFSEIETPSAAFALSGTVVCGTTGPISDVEISVWDQMKSTVVTSDTTDRGGTYSVTLDGGTYYVEFIPPVAAGLNAEAFTTIELITDTILDVEFCLCSGAWVTETIDQVGDVGADTSLALAPSHPYTPHVSYHEIVTADEYYLKYAWLSSTTWVSETVDSGGMWTSLALVPTSPYPPCISHHHWLEYYGTLKYACRDDTTWITETVAGERAGQNGTSLELEPTYPYTPHISYHYAWGTYRNLSHGYLSGTTWCSGTWVKGPIEPPGSRTGWWSSLVLERTYRTLHVSYYDQTNSDLNYAWLSGANWLSETVDSEGSVGWYTSLALDGRRNPHISYHDGTNNALKYAWFSDTTWLSETLDSAGQQSDWSAGATSLALDQAGAPHISYYDATSGDLKLARRDGTVWIIQTVDSSGDVGQYSSLALDKMGCPHISYYDATNGDLKYAYIPPHYVFLPLAMRNYP